MNLVKQYHPNTDIYRFAKGCYQVTDIYVSVGEYEGEYDVNVLVCYYDKWYNTDTMDFTPATYSTEKDALKHAKGVYNTLVKRFDDKVTWEGLENC